MFDTKFSTNVSVDVKINGLSYGEKSHKLERMYQLGSKSRWSPDEINWIDDIAFGSELAVSSDFAFNEFKKSKIGDGGYVLWNAFRWELQSWLVCQFLYGEQAALVTSSQLVMSLSAQHEKLVTANQVADEAKHVDVFSRYIDSYISDPYVLSGDLKNMVIDTVNASELDITIIGMQVMIECLADAIFRMGASTFHDSVIKSIVEKVASDEARHIALGIVLLKPLIPSLSRSELAIREDFILSAADAIRSRFFLNDIWERLNVSKADGKDFAINSPLMVDFRRTAFAKIASVLSKTGLMTEKIQKGLIEMALLRA